MSIFGTHRHTAVSGYANGAPYGVLAYRGTDGMGVVHIAVVVRCRKCGADFDVAMFHTTNAAFSTHAEQAAIAKARAA